jgi:uncharacterized protein YukE
MPRIVADAEELDALAQALGRLQKEIESIGARAAGYEAAGLGPERVSRAVGRVVSNWSDARERLTTELEAIAGLVAHAACCYRQTEQAVAGNFGADPGVGRLPNGS